VAHEFVEHLAQLLASLEDLSPSKLGRWLSKHILQPELMSHHSITPGTVVRIHLNDVSRGLSGHLNLLAAKTATQSCQHSDRPRTRP